MTADRRALLACFALTAIATPCAAAGPAAGLALSDLRCEARTDPLGIDVVGPRLSWIVASPERGQAQTAYRVLVSSDPDRAARREGDLWDSGKVDGDATFGIPYAGKPLTSHQRVHWRVQVWDAAGRRTESETLATWSMGLLAPADLKARWVGYDKPRTRLASPVAAFGDARWIWHAEDAPTPPRGHRLFVAGLDLPAGEPVELATLLVAADDSCRFTINGTLVATTQGYPNVAEVDVAPHLKPGPNSLRVEVENASPGPAGLIARLIVTLRNGRTVARVTDASWRTRRDPGANWHDRPLDTAGWPAAAVVGKHGDGPWGTLRSARLLLPPPALLRTTFPVAKPVRRATLYAAALGIADLYLNKVRVTEDRFLSGWTDYTRRVYYRAYDVTGQVSPGTPNALGAVLADGWYSGYVGFGLKRDHYGTKPRLLAQLHVEYADGTAEDVVTGPRWKASTGPTLEADFLMGETYDARKEGPDWNRATFDDAAWDPVDTGAEVSPKVESHPGPPVRAFATLAPKSIRQPRAGVYVLDMGQNFAGVVRLSVTGTPGQKITLRFAERLNPDGTVYTTNLRGARATDTYICKGGGTEVWEPRFTFHGFQYVEVTGLTAPPADGTITGVAITSDTPAAGRFECSDPMLNRLHENILWTQWANFIDIPTDCPQRDERLGWTGDAQVYVRTATLNADVQSFFTKWLVDLTDGQRADGQFPMVAPVKVAGDDGGPAWADAGVICPWTIYDVYGDRRLLERQYPSMVKFVEFCRRRSTNGVLPPKQYHAFGDWLSIKADTPKDVIFTAYYAYSTRLLARAAEALGKTDDAAKYQRHFRAIKTAFGEAYVGRDGRIRGDTQACYVLALAFDLLDGEAAEKAAAYLVADIEKRGGHLSTGFIGTKDLMLVLAKIGRNDVAFKLLHNTTFPSWGFSIRQGATSIWERWDGWTPERGFQDPGMNSFAHYSFGAVYQWMVENLGGIRSDGPAYARITIAPQFDPALTSAQTSYKGVRGEIASAWTRRGDALTMDVAIPANTTATVLVPAARPDAVTEGGRPIDRAEGVKLLRFENGRAVLAVGSGRYAFASNAGAGG